MNQPLVHKPETAALIATAAELQPETLALHAGWRRDASTQAVTVPIYLSTAYELTGDLDHIAQVYNAKADGFTYSRIINPTNRVLEKRFAALEGARDSRRSHGRIYRTRTHISIKPLETGQTTPQRTVLRLAFAERPTYTRNQGYRTPKTTLPFKALGGILEDR